MDKPEAIVLDIESVEDIFYKTSIPLYCRKLLNKDIELYIIEESENLHHKKIIRFQIHIPQRESERSSEVETSIRQHFSNRREKSKIQLRETMKLGWKSLIIGFAFLAIMFLITEILISTLPEGGFMVTVRELFIILGWVALWRPAELLLYEWYPHRRDARLFDKLAKSRIEIVKS